MSRADGQGAERFRGAKRAPIKFEHVTVPIDFSDCSVDALEYGIQIAKDFGACLTLLHVLAPVSYGGGCLHPRSDSWRRAGRFHS